MVSLHLVTDDQSYWSYNELLHTAALFRSTGRLEMSEWWILSKSHAT